MMNILVLLQIYPDKQTGLCPLVYLTEYIHFFSNAYKKRKKNVRDFSQTPVKKIEFAEKRWREIKIYFCTERQAILYFLGY